MTDEEMAEEYIEKNCKIWEEGELTVDEIVRLAFLAGLKAGRPQWHKVADGDLPPKMKPVLCYLFNGSYILAFLREDNVWTTNNHNAFENVHAWCEIPQFKE